MIHDGSRGARRDADAGVLVLGVVKRVDHARAGLGGGLGQNDHFKTNAHEVQRTTQTLFMRPAIVQSVSREHGTGAGSVGQTPVSGGLVSPQQAANSALSSLQHDVSDQLN